MAAKIYAASSVLRLVNYSYGSDLSSNLSFRVEEHRAPSFDTVQALGSVPDCRGTHAMLNGPTAVRWRIASRRQASIACGTRNRQVRVSGRDGNQRRILLPVCVGECLHSRYGRRPIWSAMQPTSGCLTSCAVAASARCENRGLAECYNVPIAPHNPNGPISTIASAHVAAAIPNFFRQEFMLTDVAWRDTVLDRPLPIVDGYFVLDDRPGLGFDLVESEMERHPGVRKPRAGFYIDLQHVPFALPAPFLRPMRPYALSAPFPPPRLRYNSACSRLLFVVAAMSVGTGQELEAAGADDRCENCQIV
jgi:galactonate dehydratase